MNQNEMQIVKEIKNLFLNYQLKQCIQQVDHLDKNMSIECHQNLQLYKGISLLELSQVQDGYQCFEKIVEEAIQKKEGVINEIDVVISTIYQFEVYYVDLAKAEEQNEKHLNICEEYKIQNEKNEKFQKGIYLFGKGMYLFIQQNRNNKNFDCIPYLEESYELLDEYKQAIMIILGWIYHVKNQEEISLKWNQMLYDQNPNYPGVTNNLAIVEKQLGNMEKAEQLYNQAVILSGNNPVVLQNIALLYSAIGNKQLEKDYFERMYNFNSKSAIACSKYGKFLIRNDKIQEGLEMIKNAIELDPTYIYSYEELLNFYSNNFDMENSIIYLTKCLEIHPKDGFYHFKFGEIYEKQDMYQQAIQAYIKANQFPNYPFFKNNSLSRIGFCYFVLQQYDESLRYFLLASDINNVCSIINSDEYPISFSKIEELINQQEYLIVKKYEQFAQETEDLNLKILFMQKLEILRTCLFIQSYKRNIQSFLTYQSLYSHLDLYII